MTLTLVADIGGTHARFALADENGIHDPVVLKAADYAGPVEAARAYLSKQSRKPTIGAFAIAGPITGDTLALTNIDWTFSVEKTKDALGLEKFSVINDFHAIALGILSADGIHKIGAGIPQDKGNIGIIGPGTGLGVASLVWNGAHYTAVPCEGGHVTVPAVTQREFDVVTWLLNNKYHHVSAERVCSGKGLVNVYDALRGLDKKTLPDLEPNDIANNALSATCDTCKETLDMMMAFLGRVAGNLALTLNATAGVYFAGGIFPKLGKAYIDTSALRSNFAAKGRHSGFVDTMPTYMVDDPLLAFKGLYTHAMES